MATATRVKVNIVNETEKAFQVEHQGKTFWMPKGWVKDGTISQKMADEKLAEVSARETAKPRCYRLVAARETEKAVMVQVQLTSTDGELFKHGTIWFPKSQIDEEGCVPHWLVRAKFQELVRENNNRYFVSETFTVQEVN